MKTYEWKIELNSSSYSKTYLFDLIYWKLTKPKGYRPYKVCSIRLGRESISHWVDGAILWHIQYVRLLSLEVPNSFRPASRYNNSYDVSILTKDEDKYTFECTLSPQDLEALKIEIGKIANNV